MTVGIARGKDEEVDAPSRFEEPLVCIDVGRVGEVDSIRGQAPICTGSPVPRADDILVGDRFDAEVSVGRDSAKSFVFGHDVVVHHEDLQRRKVK